MKICHHCQAVNGNDNKHCSECQGFIANDPIKDDANFVAERIKNSNRQVFWSRFIRYGIIVLFMLVYNAYIAYVCYDLLGSLEKYWALVVWYIPGFLLCFFPYDKVYCAIRKKMKKPQKHLSDFFYMFPYMLSIIYLFVMFQQSYDIWAKYVGN